MKMVKTKRWGNVWSVEGVIVVLDPRVKEKRSVLRADNLPEKSVA